MKHPERVLALARGCVHSEIRADSEYIEYCCTMNKKVCKMIFEDGCDRHEPFPETHDT
jgi:hypothetical protein